MYVRIAIVHCRALRVCGSCRENAVASRLLVSKALQPDTVYGPLEYYKFLVRFGRASAPMGGRIGYLLVTPSLFRMGVTNYQ